MRAPLVRAVGSGWETHVLDAVRDGPVMVACHRDPIPRLRRLGPRLGRGSGNRLSPRLRVLLLATITQARAEGHTWDAIAVTLGLTGSGRVQAVRYLAGKRGGPRAPALYRALHGE